METKLCRKCGLIKSITDFNHERRNKDGYKSQCRDCLNIYYKSLYPSFKQRKSDQQKKYYIQNSELIKSRVKKYANLNKEKIYLKKLEYYNSNKESIKAYRNKYTKERNKNDAEFNAMRVLRSFIYRLMICKTDKTENILGYSVSDLFNKLGRYPNENESIDHKIPISWFKSNADIRIIHSLENLQIITKSENSKKHNTFSDCIDKDYFLIAIENIKPKFRNLVKVKNNGN